MPSTECTYCKGARVFLVDCTYYEPTLEWCLYCRGTGEVSEAHKQLMAFAMLGTMFNQSLESGRRKNEDTKV